MKKSALAILLALTTLTFLPGCEKEADGPFEKAGEAFDEGVEEVADEIDDAT